MSRVKTLPANSIMILSQDSYRMQMNIKFLNVDLDIQSKQDISLILNELGTNIFVLHRGQQENYYFACLEIDRDAPNADMTINIFCDLIENFSEETSKIWNSCYYKVFDLGYESGIQPNYFTSNISSTTIKRIASIGASLNITIYPIDDNRNN